MAAEIHRQVPNWLDRLRSARGFTTDNDHLDLDHFLHHNSTPDDTLPPPPSPRPPSEPDHPVAGNAVSNVLSELFCFGDPEGRVPRRRKKNKSSRKQSNPKSCVILPPMDNENEERDRVALDSSGGENGVSARKENVEGDQTRINEGDVIEGDEEEEDELKGYARMEVTVIDTSVVEWKFERVVFRRKNVWKVREKRSKGKSFGTKKRKAGGLLCREKGKARTVDDSVGRLAKEGNGNAPPLNQEQPNERENETCHDIMIPAGEVPAKKFGCSKAPNEVKSSSVIYPEAIPTSLKAGETKPVNIQEKRKTT